MAQPKAFVGPIIHSLSTETLEIIEGVLVVGGDGKIAAVSRSIDDLEELQIRYGVSEENVRRLGSGQFLLPGLIDSHIHAPQYPNAGLGYDMPLLDWLQTYTYPLEKKFADAAFATKVYSAVVQKTLSNGTTTSCYFATIHVESSLILARIAAQLGQRAFVGKVNMNFNTPEGYGETTEESVSRTEEFIQAVRAINTALVQPVITPRFALSCDMALMQRLAALAIKYDVRIQTHVSESKSEVEAVQGLFPECANYVDVYDKAGLITNKTILAHGVFLTPEELTTLAAKGTAVAHCPNSNTMLQSGLCGSANLLKQSLKLGLGTDCAGGFSYSILDAMREAVQVSIHCSFIGKSDKLSLPHVLYLATLGGAKALSVDDVTGNFLVGKDFDALLVNLCASPNIDLFQEYDPEQLLQKFIYLGDDRCIEEVFVAGRKVK